MSFHVKVTSQIQRYFFTLTLDTLKIDYIRKWCVNINITSFMLVGLLLYFFGIRMVRKLITHGKYKYKMNLVVVGSEHGARLIYTIIFLLLS